MKTHKMPEMIRRQLAVGITRFKCATPFEAGIVAQAGAEAVLLAYPLVGEAAREAFLGLEERYSGTRFYAMGDDLEALRLLSAETLKRGRRVAFFVDVDLGMHRTGVALEQLRAFLNEANAIKGLELVGLHCYDGQVHDEDPTVRAARVRGFHEILEPIRALWPELMTIWGGTPTFPMHAVCLGEAKKNAPEREFLSPGTVFVSDAGYSGHYPDLGVRPAACLLCRVVSRPTEDTFTLDLGSKAISAEGGMLLGHPGAQPLFQNEEHWVWQMPNPPPVGTVCYVMPTHICPTTALYGRAGLVRAGRVVEKWRIERNRGVNL